jgi:circadian clock protein KaiC
MKQSKKKGASARARPTKPVVAGGEALLGAPVPKAASGIDGLDEVTAGGLPRGRPSLVIGGPGCGKTMLAAEFIVQGATRYGEPGVFMMFEETADELAANVRSLGFDLDGLVREGKVAVDYVRVERSEIEETGQYDLEGLFIRLAHAVASVGAKRVALDTLEALFSGLSDHAVLRAELRRLFRWLKDRGLTAVITAERGADTLTRCGLEEYVADCVILLDHRVVDQVSTRRLRVVKYRGSLHGTNEYPFLIGTNGILVLPITSLRLDHTAPVDRLPTGIGELDLMLGGKGFFRVSAVLVSGAPGTGKSSIVARIAEAACERGERVLFFSYEESPNQLVRNMRSIGIDLERWRKKDLLRVLASRPTLQGLEQHLVLMYDAVREFRPSVVIVDPISNLTMHVDDTGLKPMLMRLIDFLKQSEVTAVYTDLVGDDGTTIAQSQLGVSSLMDTWLMLSNLAIEGERTRALQIVKSRGMPHSNLVREFVFSARGLEVVDVFLDEGRPLTGRRRLGAQAVANAGRRGRSAVVPARRKA